LEHAKKNGAPIIKFQQLQTSHVVSIRLKPLAQYQKVEMFCDAFNTSRNPKTSTYYDTYIISCTVFIRTWCGIACTMTLSFPGPCYYNPIAYYDPFYEPQRSQERRLWHCLESDPILTPK